LRATISIVAIEPVILAALRRTDAVPQRAAFRFVWFHQRALTLPRNFSFSSDFPEPLR
jgi:hypothetical protein